MDVSDKTRVVRSPENKPGAETSAQPAPAAAPQDDVTVFAGKTFGAVSRAACPELQSLPMAQAKSVTALDRTVLAGSNMAALDAGTVTSSVTTKTLIKDRFELVNLLGSGGMGAVYRALDRRKVEANDSDPYLAVKLLNDDFRKHPDAFISLQRESRKSQSLAHPNIVTVYDFDRDGDLVFMTMEYLDGVPLDKLIRQHAGQGLEREHADAILRDVSAALTHAHSQRIVHSDFKPGNIFVTRSKGSKVFDFGIARAVSGGLSGAEGEKTQFDAGTLGALTPAYASLEMLKGEQPCQSDDVYALGCVAYELYAGRHPFNKVPADKAQAQKLKPRRIRRLSRRQWRALEAALQFSRDQRTPDAAEFTRQFFGRNRALWLTLGVALLSVSALAAAFIVQHQKQAAVDAEYKAELERSLALELQQSRIADRKEALQRLVNLAALTVDWERDLRHDLQEFVALAGSDPYADQVRQAVAEKFLDAAREYVRAGELDNGNRALARSESWQAVPSDQYHEIKTSLLAEKLALEQRLEAEAQAERDRLAAEQRAIERAAAAERARQHAVRVDELIATLDRQLRCGYSMDIESGIAGSLEKLHQLDARKASQVRPLVANELMNCLGKLAADNPRRTEPLLTKARRLLPESDRLRGLRIDYCGHLEEGSGGKGARFACADLLAVGGEGPQLVVVAGENRQRIAIGRFEVSWQELQQWCAVDTACPVQQGAASAPVTTMGLAQVQAYLGWLSQQTGYHYRLPDYREWFSAASAGGEREQVDRNCYLKYGGIEKGGELVAALAGKMNGNGLVNHVGNVSEMVRDGEGGWLAVGGNYLDPMSGCLLTSKVKFNGDPDGLVGFRVVREIAK